MKGAIEPKRAGRDDHPLNHSNPELVDLIRGQIARAGPVTFAWFMEQALYHPQHGYYASGRARLGRHGDYFTNVSVGPVFGRLLARQIAEIWAAAGRGTPFTIVEQGAHDGQLAADVLAALAADAPECFDHAQYRIVEPFQPLRARQADRLRQFSSRIRWSNSLGEMEPFTGVHISNELLDAMPVHVCVRRRSCDERDAWLELHVDWQDDSFTFCDGPISDRQIEHWLHRMPDVPAGFQLEINLSAIGWLGQLSAKLQRGSALIIDYGILRQDLLLRARGGTLQFRSQHRILDSPFAHIGNCDITAHLDWNAIATQAIDGGLDIVGFADQHHFLSGILSVYPDTVTSSDQATGRQLQTLLHPEILGRSFQVLGLCRGLTTDFRLSGFRFARDPVERLGLDRSR